jgi:ankyrin repeat protein
MNVKELPPRPSLEQYKKQAKELLRDCKSGQPEALHRLKKNHPRLAKVDDAGLQSMRLALADAQLGIAREYGFESWPKFARHIEEITRDGSPVSTFEAAVGAVVAGEATELERLLQAHPELARERSTRRHRATLLHYTGANGVEDYRQKTPRNIVRIAEILLEAGAEINASAEIYGGSTTLGLAATSVHPFVAGVQNTLIDALLDNGAETGGPGLVNACLANGRGQAAEHLARRGAPLDLEGAAGIGELESVKAFFTEDGALKTGATQQQMETGFAWACEYGRGDAVKFLLRQGVKVEAMPHGETGLHWAAYGGHVDIVKLLLAKAAPINVKDNRYGATPLDWALHAWDHPPPGASRDGYYEIVALLAAALLALDPAWLDGSHRKSLIEKVRADPRMLAALTGEIIEE